MHETNGQWTMKSNRGPDAMGGPPPNSERDAAYFKARDAPGNAYAWAQHNNAGGGAGVGGAGGAGGASAGVGGSWATASVAAQARQDPYQQQAHQGTPSISISSIGGGGTHNTGNGGTAMTDGSYEKNMIMELCPPGGMKAEPPPDKLAQFARAVPNLNADLVCPALLDCLEDGQPWIIRAKAICVMETCIRYGQKPGAPNNPYADFFHACHTEIAPLTNHARAAIRDPAKRVLQLLGVAAAAVGTAPTAAGAAPVAAPPPAAAAAPPAPVPNLLDFDDDTPAPAPAAAAPIPPQQAPPAPPFAAPPAAVAGGGSLFGGLTLQTSAAAPPAPTARPPPPPTSGNLLGELMSASASASASVASAAAAASASAVNQSSSSSMFDNMSLKGPEITPAESTPEQVSLAPPTGASSFGFINQSNSGDTEEKNTAAAAAAPPPPQMESFDPLSSFKNMTPNTAKQMMQLSPEQMQAMAYQNMMMQQQQRQMQMQMMAMQQQQHQQQNQQQQHRGSATKFMPMPGISGHVVMQNPAAAKTAFAFGEIPKKADDKSFDFIKDTVTMEKKK
jgi:hypothetical protein